MIWYSKYSENTQVLFCWFVTVQNNNTERINKLIQRLHLGNRYDSYGYNSQIVTSETVHSFIIKKIA